MHRFAPVALATILAAAVPARPQAQTPFTPPQATGRFTDPANLAGERVRPRDGRELPIDGGEGNNALGLAQMLRKLNTRASLMLIVAHPDDEDGGMLTYYSRGLGARVAVLTLTRGEGGQNQMTGDFEDALGLLRTQELLAADRYMGVDQFFGTEVDFGFTKTKAEAFQKWNHERVLYDAVRAVRIYRPLVIASVFEGAVTDGHGQHQVSGQIAQEVFKAAGDPKVFPELTKEGILPWQPLKVYERVPFSRVTDKGLYDYATGQVVPAQFTNYVTGQTFSTEPTADITIHEGQTDPLLTTCAASPSDLPATLSSRPEPTNTLSSRPERSGVERPASSPAPTATGCHPLSYVQFARIGLGLQRSQIGAGMRIPPPGPVDVGYHRYGPKLKNKPGHEETFFDGVDTSIEGIGTLAPDAPPPFKLSLSLLQQEIGEASKALGKNDNPAPLLADAMHSLEHVTKDVDSLPVADIERANLRHELAVKHVQLNNALLLTLGVSLSTKLVTDFPRACTTTIFPGCVAKVETNFTNGKEAPVRVVSDFSSYTGESARERTWAPSTATLQPGERLWPERSSFEIVPGPLPGGSTIEVTPENKEDAAQYRKEKDRQRAQAEGRPYFFRPNVEQPYYNLSDPALRLAPQTPSDAFWTRFSYAGLDLLAGCVITTSKGPTDPGVPLVLAPVLSVSMPAPALVTPLNDGDLRIDVSVRNSAANSPAGDVELKEPTGWPSPSPQLLPSLRADETKILSFTITPPKGSREAVDLLAEADTTNGRVAEGYRFVGYPGLVTTPLYTKAQVRVVPVDLKLPPPAKRRIAYLPGTGDDVPAALASIGLTPTILKVSDLTPDTLAHFDTVVLGVRTYNAHPDLHGAPTQALLDFARKGGNVVVQYQTPEFTAADAPYPLVDHNERVIDETAPVALLTAGSSQLKTGLDPETMSAESLLTTPNKITRADFNGWIEERGHGFLDTWDPHYTALTETHDPGAPAEHIEPQAPQRGGLITTRLGKGRWTYCAFALYRQLPEAVPGAFRLFVNLLNPYPVTNRTRTPCEDYSFILKTLRKFTQ